MGSEYLGPQRKVAGFDEGVGELVVVRFEGGPMGITCAAVAGFIEVAVVGVELRRAESSSRPSPGSSPSRSPSRSWKCSQSMMF
jgi:hypothetical protein